MLSKAVQFIRNDIWRIRARKLSRRKSILIRLLRAFLLSLREFSNDQCQLRASALTFYSMLSIVPVFALAFGIAQGFGFSEKLEEWIRLQIHGQEEVLNQIILFANRLLDNTKGSVIAGFGVAFLFWTVVKVLGHIEKSFDYIWGVPAERSLLRKFTDYLSLMLICPVLIIAASSINVFITTQVTSFTQKMVFGGYVGPVIFSILSILPYCVLWGLLTFIYVYLPNTKVEVRAALAGGIIAGTLYQLVQWVYITFQLQVSQLGAIYGSFAALPFFLIWLQVSWLIVLYGAEIAFACQNEERFEFEPESLNASQSFKRLVALRIVQICIQNMQKGKGALSETEIEGHLDSTTRLAKEVIHHLVTAGILARVENEKEESYLPAKDINTITVKMVMDAMDNVGNNEIPIEDSKDIHALKKKIEELNQDLAHSKANILLKDVA